jgi:hypothetical protein
LQTMGVANLGLGGLDSRPVEPCVQPPMLCRENWKTIHAGVWVCMSVTVLHK